MTNDSINNMDPNILLSIINMKLRDQYSSLDLLCDDLGLIKENVTNVLGKNGYDYNKNINQFK